MQSNSGSIDSIKSGLMQKVALLAFLVISLWFLPRFLVLISKTSGPIAIIVLAIFWLFIELFWLYGIYQFTGLLFSLFGGPNTYTPPTPNTIGKILPSTAILYCTKDDFQWAAAESCVNQDYLDFHVFLLDDSQSKDGQEEVEIFHQAYLNQTTLIRRPNNTGFKAGNINYALTHVVNEFPYIAIVDSDGVLTIDFLSKLVPYFSFDDRLAFVQARCEPNPKQKTQFAKDLCAGIGPLWNYFLPQRNYTGFLPFLGHSGVMNYSAWKEVGGFPEVVSEDLAISCRFREKGFQGLYIGNVISYEDFPADNSRLRRQQEKYLFGFCEFMKSGLYSFIQSPRVQWFEKIDMVLTYSRNLLPAIYLVFLFWLAFMVPLFFRVNHFFPATFLGVQISTLGQVSLGDRLNEIWGWDFYILTIVTALVPSFIVLRAGRRGLFARIRLLTLSYVTYVSLMVLAVIGVISYLITQSVTFRVTGARDEQKTYGRKVKFSSLFIRPVNSEHPLVEFAEIFVGLVLGIVFIRTLNPTFFALALCLLTPWFIRWRGWSDRLLRVVLTIPFPIMVMGLVGVGTNLVGMQGAFFFFLPIHM